MIKHGKGTGPEYKLNIYRQGLIPDTDGFTRKDPDSDILVKFFIRNLNFISPKNAKSSDPLYRF